MNADQDKPDADTLTLAPETERDEQALSLTDFLDIAALQEVQDSFSSVTRLETTIRDADGESITAPTDSEGRSQSDTVLDFLLTGDAHDADDDSIDDAAFVAPIVVDGRELGYIEIAEYARPAASRANRNELREVAEALGVSPSETNALVDAAEQACGPNKAASVQFLYVMANYIARLCYQEYELRHRVSELSALYKLSTMLAGKRQMRNVLDTATRTCAEVMNVKAAAIRLLNHDGTKFVPRSAHGLSGDYLNNTAVPIDSSEIFREASKGQVVYVADMSSDPRVLFPGDAEREGFASMLCAAMMLKDRPIGSIQIYTAEKRKFDHHETKLLQAIANQLASAVENARLRVADQENRRFQRQLQMAAAVQKRLLPRELPNIPPFDIAARYVPSYELSGDFYDLINLGDNLGIAVGDVVGKGVAASLLMASVRASLRAYAQDLYEIDEIISRVNIAMERDTETNEFVTLFYGVLDPERRRMTFSNAGHDPPLLLRDGTFIELQTGDMIVGVDPEQTYSKLIIDFEPGDLLLLYTDGLPDAVNFDDEKFGRQRIRDAMLDVADASAQDAMNHILWQMRRFVGLRRNIDDTTLVVVKVDQ